MVYSNTGMTALAYALSASLKGTPQSDIYTLLKERIMEPLGIPNSDWKISYKGMVKMNGFQLYEIVGGAAYTARAAARVEQLLIQKGNWKGRQLIDSELIEKMISYDKAPMADDFKHHPRASLGWWTNRDGVWPELPRDAFVGAGRGHQILLVIPSLDLVAVKFGKSLSKKSGYGPSAPSSLNLRLSSSIFSRLALRSISLTLLCLPRSPRFARQKNLDKPTLRFKLDGALVVISGSTLKNFS